MNLTLTILGIDDSMLIIHTKNTLNTQEYIPYIMNSNNSQSVQAEECDVSKMSATEECSQCKKLTQNRKQKSKNLKWTSLCLKELLLLSDKA